jgi:heterodisulfide reductase subunit B2
MMDIAYYPGCTLASSSRLYDVQTRMVLSALGIRLLELEDWNCCGATSSAKTDDFLSIALPARNLGIADRMAVNEVVVPCSACFSRMIVARERLRRDPELLSEINADLDKKVTGKTEVVSILKVLTQALESGTLNASAKKSLKGIRPVCYYGCLQTRFPDDIPLEDDAENPQAMERILSALGATPLDWALKTTCCGASASVNDPGLAFRLMANLLNDALARDADCFVTPCPMCQLNLDAYQTQVAQAHGIKGELPVYFITELVGLALGQDAHDLQIDRHITDAMGLLERMSLR